jgi:hypothetical protein
MLVVVVVAVVVVVCLIVTVLVEVVGLSFSVALRLTAQQNYCFSLVDVAAK